MANHKTAGLHGAEWLFPSAPLPLCPSAPLPLLFKDQSGFALVMVMVTVLILETICLFLTQARGIQTMMAFNRTRKLRALYLAEAGLAHGLWRIQEDPNWRAPMNNVPLGGGSYTISFTEGTDQINIDSRAVVGGSRSAVTKTVCRLTIQPRSSGDFRGEDTYISQDDEHNNYEDEEPKELWLDSETNKQFRTLVRFDLARYPLPPDGVIIAARFSMYMFKAFSDDPSEWPPDVYYRLHLVTRQWRDFDATWEKRLYASWWRYWYHYGGDFDSGYEDSLKFTNFGWQTWAATGLIRFWLEYPSQNYGLILETDPRSGNYEFKFRSSANDINPAISPKLTVYYLDARRP